MRTTSYGLHGWCAGNDRSAASSAGSEKLRLIVSLGILTAAASAVQIAESSLPRLLPWLKPGLSNALVLYALIRMPPFFAWTLVLFRSLVTGIILGTLFTPTGWMSLAGGAAAVATMSLAAGLGQNRIGLSGISVTGAVAHNIAQLAVAGCFAGSFIPILLHLPIMLGAAVPSGLVVAALTHQLLRRTP